MQRLLLLVTALVMFTMPALAQNQPARQPLDTWTRKQAKAERSSSLPVETIPTQKLRGYNPYGDDELGVPGDSLTEAQILRRISRVYAYQAEILVAESNGDAEHVEGLLELAMADLSTLAEQPGIMERERYREVYRSLITEYEKFYGVSDPDLAMPYGQIYQLRAEVFAVLDEVDQPLLEDVMMPSLPPMETTVPMTTNRVVERTINYFLTNKRDVLERWAARADTYFPMIEQIFREEGVPDELKYLAMVESGINPRARSWAKAVGMWQFIAATGGAYGLEVNAYVDERMDPEKSTRAAARHLRDLYRQYGNNWHVALAGYNCSPRCIKRAIRRAGGTIENPPSYWEMYDYLPRETRGYVPQFIAFSLIMSNPQAFGLTNLPHGPRYTYDSVPVQGMMALSDIAAMAGTDVATIQALNPELQRSTLPPSGTYTLRLPSGTYRQFAEAFEKIPQEEKPAATEYIVRRGDSLGKISGQYGISVAALKHANGLRSNTIHPGQHLVVPVSGYTGPVKLAANQARTIEYGTRVIRPIEPLDPGALAAARGPSPSTPVVQASASSTTTSTASKPATPPQAEAKTSNDTRVVYKVRRGDSLSKIAAKYGVSVQEIQSWNNLRGTRIQSGQQLVLYASGGAPSQPERVVYQVRRGDNLTEIAKKYSVTVSSIKQWNNLRSNTIRVGQRLTIHPGQSAPDYVVHKVRRGESLGKIASRYGTSVSRLKQWNGLRRNTIHPGQSLKIYR